MLKEEHVPTALNLRQIFEKRNAERGSRRYRDAHDLAPAMWLVDCRTAHRGCAPIVSDDYRTSVATERFVQCVRVTSQRRRLIGAGRSHRGRGVTALERCYRTVTTLGQFGHEVAPRVR